MLLKKINVSIPLEKKKHSLNDFIVIGTDVHRVVQPALCTYVAKYFVENYHLTDDLTPIESPGVFLVFTYNPKVIDDDTRYKITSIVNFVNAFRDVRITDLSHTKRQIFLRVDYSQRLYGSRHKFTQMLAFIDYVLNGYVNERSGFYKICPDTYDVTKEDDSNHCCLGSLRYKGLNSSSDAILSKQSSDPWDRRVIRSLITENDIDTNRYYYYMCYERYAYGIKLISR